MNFIPTKFSIGLLLCFLIEGNFPYNAKSYEDTLLKISESKLKNLRKFLTKFLKT